MLMKEQELGSRSQESGEQGTGKAGYRCQVSGVGGQATRKSHQLSAFSFQRSGPLSGLSIRLSALSSPLPTLNFRPSTLDARLRPKSTGEVLSAFCLLRSAVCLSRRGRDSHAALAAYCLLPTAPVRCPKDRGLCPCGEPCSIPLAPEGSKATRNSKSRNYREHCHQQGKEPAGLNLGV